MSDGVNKRLLNRHLFSRDKLRLTNFSMEELRKACRERKSYPFVPLPIKFQQPYQVMPIQVVDNVQIAELKRNC